MSATSISAFTLSRKYSTAFAATSAAFIWNPNGVLSSTAGTGGGPRRARSWRCIFTMVGLVSPEPMMVSRRVTPVANVPVGRAIPAPAPVPSTASHVDRCTGPLRRPVGGLEEDHDPPDLVGGDGQRLAEGEVIGEVALEGKGLRRREREAGLAQAVVALVPGQRELGRRLGVMRPFDDETHPGLEALEGPWSVPVCPPHPADRTSVA